jgi:hypothetical protein
MFGMNSCDSSRLQVFAHERSSSPGSSRWWYTPHAVRSAQGRHIFVFARMISMSTFPCIRIVLERFGELLLFYSSSGNRHIVDRPPLVSICRQ